MKFRNTKSPTLALALEVVPTSLLASPGMHYTELEKAVGMKVKCSPATAQRAIRLHYGDGSLTTKKDGCKQRYYWEDAPGKVQSDRLLPTHRRIVSAANAPRAPGVRMSPIEWVAATLMGVG